MSCRPAWCTAFLLTALAWSAGSAAAGGLVPQHVEKLRPALEGASRGDGASLEFTAFGRSFHLQLSSNRRLSGVAAGSSTLLYAGTLTGVPKSWARISIHEGVPRGMIWDGSDLFIVDAGAEAADSGAAGTVIFKLADAVLERGVSFTGDTVSAPREPAAAYDAMIGELRSNARALQAAVATQFVEVSVLGDAAYRARFGSDTQAHDALLTRLNNVDGIFSAQVGVELHVVSVNIADEITAGLSATTDSSALLDELGRLRQGRAALSATGVTHLFTGRQLDGNTAGVAYTVSLCSRRFGASVAMAHNSATLDSLITAHEIGHVFGAPHDGVEQCASTPQGQYIMTPTLDTSVTSFSQCSLDAIEAVIGSYSCLRNLVPADLSLPASLGAQSVAAGSDFAWLVSITNVGGQAAAGARATLQVTPALTISAASTAGGSCVIQTGLVTCDLPDVAAGATQAVQLTLRSATEGSFALHAQVVQSEDGNASNDSGDGTLTVSGATPAPTPPAGSSNRGGGGALDPNLLFLLFALLGLARAPRSDRTQV